MIDTDQKQLEGILILRALCKQTGETSQRIHGGEYRLNSSSGLAVARILECEPYNGHMSTPVLATKLYIPPHRPKLVSRPRLVRQLNDGLHSKLTLISAPAGFGKSTLVSEWVA